MGVHAIHHRPEGRCFSRYYGKTDDGEKEMHMLAKIESNLEAKYVSGSSWNFFESGASCHAEKTIDVKACPLKIREALSIQNLNVTGGLTIYIDYKTVTKLELSHYAKVSYDMALGECNNLTECTLSFVSKYGEVLGEVVINPDDGMKIVSITSTRPGYARITKIEPFNAVAVGYTSVS